MKLSSRKQLRPRERLGACRTCDRTSGRDPRPDPPGIPAPATLRSHSPRLADLGQEWVARGFLEGSCQWRKDGHRRAPALRGRQCSLRFLKTSAVFPGGLQDCLGRGFDNEKMPANPSGKMRSSKEKSSKQVKRKGWYPGSRLRRRPRRAVLMGSCRGPRPPACSGEWGRPLRTPARTSSCWGDCVPVVACVHASGARSLSPDADLASGPRECPPSPSPILSCCEALLAW